MGLCPANPSSLSEMKQNDEKEHTFLRRCKKEVVSIHSYSADGCFGMYSMCCETSLTPVINADTV